jgi:hypothetical protein
MSDKFTAAQAAGIAKAKDPSFAVETILAGVKKAAGEGRYEYKTREFGFGDGSCYTSEDKYPPLCKAIIQELRQLGYKVRIGIQESQFVDIWLEVSWMP